MYSRAARFSQLRHVLTAVVVSAVAGGGVLIGLGIVRFADADGLWLIVTGAGAILAAAWASTVAFIALKVDANTMRTSAAIRDLYDELERYGAKLDAIAASTRLSDVAKSIAHREEERNALRAAIYNEIDLHNWEAAYYLVSEMERRFGTRDEGQRLRDRLNEARSQFYDEEVAKALPHIQSLFKDHRWNVAAEEIGRLMVAFPNEPRFKRLEQELTRLKEARKQQLVRDFTAAVDRDDIDIDTGMDVLKELDQYLTRAEAAELEASARKVVKGKLLQLGVRFRFAVTEERWPDALEVAVRIMDEFPNSTMAREVGQRLDALRARAGLPANVEVTSPATEPPGE